MFRHVFVCIVMAFLLAIPCVVRAADDEGERVLPKKPSAEEPDGTEAIKEAITLLKDRKESAEGKNDQSQIDAAIHALEKLLTVKGKIVKKTVAKESDNTAVVKELKKKLHGKAAYNAKTKELTVTYDWASKRQLDDFDLSKATPECVRGSLVLRPGDSVRHIVDFEKVNITVPVLVPQMRGTIMSTTSGIRTSLGGGNFDLMQLAAENRGVDGVVPGEQRKGLQQVKLTVEQGRVAFLYGNGTPSQLGMPATICHAGQVELCGGDAGFQFGKLVLTGTIGDEGLTRLLSDSIPKK